MHETGQLMTPDGAIQHYRQSAIGRSAELDVLYVHGATFPSACSIFFEMDGRSWATALNQAGFNVWGFDFLGFGNSARYGDEDSRPVCRRVPQAALQLAHTIRHIYEQNGRRPIALLAHSWGTLVALEVAASSPGLIDRLVLFGPISTRQEAAAPDSSAPRPSTHCISVWEQYRNFTSDIPVREPEVLLDRHFERWAQTYLASDPLSGTRAPQAVRVPFGPIADVLDTWSGAELVDASRIVSPTLIVRGEWDSACTDADAQVLLGKLTARVKRDTKLGRGAHRMHLEEGRPALHDCVNAFLGEVLT